MKSARRRHLKILATAVTTVLALSACSSEPGPDNPSGETMTVESNFGTVELPTEPKAALGMYTTDVDILIHLGVPLAKDQPIRGDSGYTTFPRFFPQEELEGVTPFANYPEFSYEKIAAANPDFILNGLGYEPDVVERLPEIAPTYSIDAFDGKPWTEHFKRIATDLGREDRYEQWVEKYDRRVAEIKAELEKRDISPLVASLNFYQGQIAVDCYGLPCLVFKDLGLEVTPLATASDEGTSLSLEELEQLSGIEFAVSSIGAGGEDSIYGIDELNANPIWTNLPIVRNKTIYNYELEMVYGSPSGQMAFLEFLADSLLGDE